MSPGSLLSLSLLLTASAAVAERALQRLHRGRLRRLAREWRMNYSPLDQFRLTQRVIRDFPVPGAANIRVQDLIYGLVHNRYRYVFTAEYTIGVLSAKRRVQRAGALSEPRDATLPPLDSAEEPIALAPAGLPLLDQYRMLRLDAARVLLNNPAAVAVQSQKGIHAPFD